MLVALQPYYSPNILLETLHNPNEYQWFEAKQVAIAISGEYTKPEPYDYRTYVYIMTSDGIYNIISKFLYVICE